MKKLFPLLCLTVANTAVAADETYNFSDELITAVENCSSYHEDFTKSNPLVVETIQAFTKVKPSINIDIEGYKNGKCAFSVTGKLGQLGKTVYDCAIDQKMREKLLTAMRDKSNEKITKTIEITNSTDDADETTVNTSSVTMTATRFDIIQEKMLYSSACTQKNIPLTEEEEREIEKEIEKINEEENRLPSGFTEALKNCSSGTYKDAEIKGFKDGKCIVFYEDYILSLTPESIKTVASWEDFDNLSENSAVSKYNYMKNYTGSGLLQKIYSCYNGKCTTGGQGLSTSWSDKIKKQSGLGKAQCFDTSCSFDFVNIITINDKTTDYSLVCAVPKTEMKSIIDEYAEAIDKYVKNDVLTKNASPEEMMKRLNFMVMSSDATKEIDNTLLERLQKKNLCRLKNGL